MNSPTISEQRVREIIREEIEWAFRISGSAAKQSPRSSTATPAAKRRAERYAAIAADYAAGVSVNDCATKHGVSAATAYKAIRLNVGDRASARQNRLRPIADDYEAGLSVLDCAIKHGCCQQTVREALRVCGVMPRPRAQKRGLDQRASRMIEMRGEGATLEQIGAEFQITRERVRQILHEAGVSTKANDRPLSPEQKAAVEEYVAERGNLVFYAAKFGVDKTTFRNWVLRCGHTPHDKGNKLTPLVKARAERVAQMYLEGVPTEEIAKHVGFAHATAVYLDLARAGIKPQRLRMASNEGASQ